MTRLATALLALLIPAFATAADPLRFHYPDSGSPPWMYLAPGADRPTGVVAEILEQVAQATGRPLRYEFQPRETAGQSLRGGTADGALFYSVTRPAPKDAVLTEALLRMESVLVTDKARRLGYEKPAQLADQRLCTLTDEAYPPLALLAMSGKLLQRKGKTEQAQLMMLRNEDCVAAVLSAPTWQWLAARYHWDDLRVEPQPLLSEELVLGFAARESAFAARVDATVKRLRASGEFARLVQRYLPGHAAVTTR